MKIYIPNISNTVIGGGFTFCRNLKKALFDKVEFVNTWQECDIIFVFGITAVHKAEIHTALDCGKKLVLRVDNIPRRSRNRRQSPAERLREFGDRASAVIYQSEWCKKYAKYFAGDGTIINNGVDDEVFNMLDRKSDDKTYLYANFNDNPNKRFDEAIYTFEMRWRRDHNIHLKIAGNVPRIYLDNPDYNWDLNVSAKVEYLGILKTPQEVAKAMKMCDYILFPSFAEAYPNTLLEAIACGLKPVGLNMEGGAWEVWENSQNGVKTIQEMGEEYLEIFNKIIPKL